MEYVDKKFNTYAYLDAKRILANALRALMLNNYFDLPMELQKTLLEGAETQIGFSARILEKDIWICVVLEALFSLNIPMIFKGGTSLSKAYGLIDRFSEDIDITIDYRFFEPDIDLSELKSRSQMKKISDSLKSQLKRYVQNDLIFSLRKIFENKYSGYKLSFDLSPDSEEIRIIYPSHFVQENDYLQHNVLLEFGARNSIHPYEVCEITPVIEKILNGLNFPHAKVKVLSPARTFWEKATLIHVECHRERLRMNSERLSRHWYDLARLANSWVGTKALEDNTLLEDVVLHKSIFFDSSYANYVKCLEKQFRLYPVGNDYESLKLDYKIMQEAGMFIGEPIAFDTLMSDIKQLEDKLNKRT